MKLNPVESQCNCQAYICNAIWSKTTHNELSCYTSASVLPHRLDVLL